MAINKNAFVVINKDAYILSGQCKGVSGKLVAFDATTNEVTLRIDDKTSIITDKENIIQVDNYVDLPCNLKDCSTCGECD